MGELGWVADAVHVVYSACVDAKRDHGHHLVVSGHHDTRVPVDVNDPESGAET